MSNFNAGISGSSSSIPAGNKWKDIDSFYADEVEQTGNNAEEEDEESGDEDEEDEEEEEDEESGSEEEGESHPLHPGDVDTNVLIRPNP